MFQPARGTRDFLPEEMLRRDWVLDRVREVFEVYGYEPLGTPAFESFEMLKIKSGEDVIDQIYYFRDKSDRELGLRFEWTSSLARVVASHRELPMPFKRYAIGPVWRYESPSEKRFREFWQADADIIGVADPIADVEALAVAVDCLRSIGFEGFIIRLNDRRILNALLQATGLPVERSLEIFRAVDKLAKIGEDGVTEELSRVGASGEASRKLLELIALKGEAEDIIGQIGNIISGMELGMRGCETLSSILEYATSFGIRHYMLVDLSLARGLDYYTGQVYEIQAKGFEDYGSIAGGGRYDEIIQLFGGDPTPATGISLGIERIVPLLEKKGVFSKIELGTKVYVAPASEGVRSRAIELAQKLRREGVQTNIDLMGRGLARQLDFANRKGARYVVLVGERELAEGKATLRDMKSGEQREVRLSELAEVLMKG